VATGSTLASEDRIVVGKNYRLQDIQLSKNRWSKLPASQPVELACARASLQKLVARFTPAPPSRARSVSLAGTCDCYISVTGVQAEAAIWFLTSLPRRGPPSPFGLRRDSLRLRRQASAGWPAEPKPAFASRLACRAVAALTRSFGAAKAGGEYRARTGDLLVANQALSQLS
jgi:hypothetical protein